MLANSADFHLDRAESEATAFPEDPFIKMEESETVTAKIVNSTQDGKAGETSSTAESLFGLVLETGADAGAKRKKGTSKKHRKNAETELLNNESSALELTPPLKVRSAKKKRMDSKEKNIEILPEIKRTNSVEYSKNEVTQYLALIPNKNYDKADESLEEADGLRGDMPEDSSTSYKYCEKKLKKKKRKVLEGQANEDQVKDTKTFRKTKDTNELSESYDIERNKLFKRSQDEIYPFDSTDSDECDESLVLKQTKCENMEINSTEQKKSGTRKSKITIESELCFEGSVLKYEPLECTSGEENELRGNIFETSTKSFSVKMYKNPATKREPRTLPASLKNTMTKSDVRALNGAAKDEEVLDEKFAEAINSSTYSSSENEQAANMTPKTKKQKKEKPDDDVISFLSPQKKVKEIAAERKKINLNKINYNSIETADANELSLPKDSSQEEASDLSALEMNGNIKKRQKVHKKTTRTENKVIDKICSETSDATQTEQPLRKRLKKKKLDDSIEEEHHDSRGYPVLQTTVRTGKSKSKSLQKAINKREISNDESTTLNLSQQNDASDTNDDSEIKPDSDTESDVKRKSKEHFSCELCAYSTKVAKHFRLHLSQEHDIKNPNTRSFECRVSPKSPKPRPRNFMCSYCNKCFTCRYNLKIHHSTHTGESLPYPCSHSGCSKSFATPAATKNHEVSAHSDERSYVCTFCGKSFALIYGLRTHLSWCDTRNSLFTCSNCGKQFRVEWKYVAHVTNKKCKDAEHECEFKLCNKRFVDTYRLRRHMMRVHNVPMHIKKT